MNSNDKQRERSAAGREMCAMCGLYKLPQACSSAPQPGEIDTLLTRKEVMHKLDIKDSAYARWVEHGILVPRIMGKRHCYADDNLDRAFKESMRKGKR